jgi:hypothetical protein
VLAVVAADGIRAEELLGLEVPADGSVSGDVMRTAEPVVLETPRATAARSSPWFRADAWGRPSSSPSGSGT